MSSYFYSPDLAQLESPVASIYAIAETPALYRTPSHSMTTHIDANGVAVGVYPRPAGGLMAPAFHVMDTEFKAMIAQKEGRKFFAWLGQQQDGFAYERAYELINEVAHGIPDDAYPAPPDYDRYGEATEPPASAYPYYCPQCDTLYTRKHVRQAERSETCVYVCRTCNEIVDER